MNDIHPGVRQRSKLPDRIIHGDEIHQWEESVERTDEGVDHEDASHVPNGARKSERPPNDGVQSDHNEVQVQRRYSEAMFGVPGRAGVTWMGADRFG